MSQKYRILFVGDVLSDAELICQELAKHNLEFEKVIVDNRDDYLKKIESFLPDIIISDFTHPQLDGMAALMIRNEKIPLVPFILVTGSVNEEIAVECMKAGADDYILKENLSRLGSAFTNSVEKSELLKQKNYAEIALRESEERFRILYNDAIAGLYRTNLQGEIFLANTALVKMLGFESFEELSKRNLKDEGFSRAIHRQEFIEIMSRDGEIRDYESIWTRRDGSEINVRESARVFIDGDGKILYYDGIVQDITEQKRAGEAIRESKQLIEGILNTIPVRVFWKDKTSTYLGCNDIFARDAGFNNSSDIVGKTDHALVWHKQAELYIRDDAAVIESGISRSNFEEIQTTPDGKVITLLTSKSPLRSFEGKITGILGTYVDITDRKLVEEKLSQSHMFNESLLSTIPFGMHIVDEKGNVLFLSNKFKELLGEEAIGKKCWELCRDDKTQCSDCPLMSGIEIGKTESYESRGVLGDRIFEISHTGMMYQGKKAMLEIFQDISDKKRNENELIAAKEKAEESDRLKTAFLNNISHEIRTPMNAIVGFSALLGEQPLDRETQQIYIETIMQSSDHLLSIISDIVDISNIEAKLVKIVLSDIDAKSTVSSICDRFSLKAADKNINLECNLELTDLESMIIADTTKLNQILSNLIDNALKFTRVGTISVGARLTGDFLQFSVSDTGIGIPQEFHHKIFDRFFQVDNGVSRLHEGTGLGLSIIKAYIEIMGGRIWLKSEVGKGTIFFFEIPYLNQSYKLISVEQKDFPGPIAFNSKKTILVAEDDEGNFRLISYYLNRSNVNIVRACTGKEAFTILTSAMNVDIILMDIKMPEMDGYTAVKLIRDLNIDIPIIAQTAYASDREKAMDIGCSDYITKPFDRKTLLRTVHKYI
jgi:PAS domain S-box-containing protein